MQGLLTHFGMGLARDEIAERATRFADVLLAELAKEKP